MTVYQYTLIFCFSASFELETIYKAEIQNNILVKLRYRKNKYMHLAHPCICQDFCFPKVKEAGGTMPSFILHTG